MKIIQYTKYIFALLIFVITSFSAHASHIIGGELNLIHIAEDSFRISLHVYYDDENSALDVLDNQVKITAFSDATQLEVESFLLPKTVDRELPYSSLGCRLPNYIIQEVVYSKIVKLDPSNYAQIAGYYLAWERCCRNGILDNIENSFETGLAVFLQFPALVQNGEFTPNSSPVFSNLVGDYACLNQWYFVDFEAFDADGDELKFSLVNPLGGHATSSNNAPNTQPKPYNSPAIQWKSLQGYSVNTQVRGTPSLEISETGRLRVKPVERGQFLFAVRCEEFRNGKKIGEKIREFQILVQECPTIERNFPEADAFRTLADITPISDSDTIEFEMDEIDKRIYIKVTDQDVDSVRIRALPVQGFTQGAIITDSLGLLTNSTDPHIFTVSYPHCPEDSGGVYADRFFLSDLTCGQPYEDTVTVFVRVKERLHKKPEISVVADSVNTLEEYIFEGVQYDTIAIPMSWVDDDADSIIYLNVSHFRDSLPQNPFTDSVRTYPAIDQDTLFWEVPCDLFKGVADTVLTYHFPIIITDNLRCGFEKSDTVDIQVLIRNRHQFRYNTRPEVVRNSRDPISNTLAVYLDTAYLNKDYAFRLHLADLEADSVFIKWEAENFIASEFNFPIDSIKTDSLGILFLTWSPKCWYLDKDSLYKSLKTRIIVQDFSVCDTMIYSDTIYLDLTLTSDNQKPNIWTELPDYRYDRDISDSIYFDSIRVNAPLQLSINAPDFEGDTIVMRLNTELDSVLHDFRLYRNEADTSGTNEHFFEWIPNCEYFFDPDSVYEIPIEFIATDLDECYRQKSDTLRTILYVLPDTERSFEPYFFTDLDSISTQFYVDSVEIGSSHKLNIGASGLGQLIMENEVLSTDFLTITTEFVSVHSLDSIQTEWIWEADCRYFSEFDSLPEFFDVQFRVNSYACTENLADTATVRLFLKYPKQQAPDLKIISLTDTLKNLQTEITAGNPLHFGLFADSIPASSWLRITPDFDTLKNPIHTQIIRQDSVLKYSFSLISECSKDTSDLNLRYILADTSACNFGADTVFISVRVLPTPDENNAPKLNLDLNYDINNQIYTDSVFIGEKFTLNLTGNDIDFDSLFLTPISENFDFEEVGAEFLSISSAGDFSTVFSWQTSCKALNITGQEFESKTFEFDLILKDKKYCLPKKQDSVRVRWVVLGRPELNQSPEIELDLAQNSDGIYTVDIFEGERLAFPIRVEDIDQDPVTLEVSGLNFSFSEVNFSFREQEKNAPYIIDFEWDTECDLIENDAKIFEFILKASDFPVCGNPLSDEVRVLVQVVPQITEKPIISINLPQNSDGVFEQTLTENEEFSIEIFTENSTPELVEWTVSGEGFSLEEINAKFDQNSDFKPVLSWIPECGLSEKQSDFQFVIEAKIPTSGCRVETKSETKILLKIVPPQATFEHPTNVLTPNGDGKNDVFYLPNILDACGNQTYDFQHIEIVNRWGNVIFESENPVFEWDLKNVPAGVYFYAIQIKNKEVYRGNITIIK